MKRPDPTEFLILSASTGNGHISAAIATEVEMRERGVQAWHQDTLLWTPKLWKLWYGGGYEFIVRRAPGLWGNLYFDSDKEGWKYDFQTWMDTQMCWRLDQLVEWTNPTWTVCTHSLPQPKLAEIRSKRNGPKMAVVVTDLWPHKMWLRGEPDWFFTPSEWSADELEKRMPGARARTTVTGIPVHPAFNDPRPKAEIRKALGLPLDEPVLLLTAGGIGAGPMVPMLKKLSQSPIPITVVCVCGRNQAAYRKVLIAKPWLTSGSQMTLKLHGHMPRLDMAAHMNACDLLMGKPGGLTTSEALVAGCPFLVADPFVIPGQEEGNRDFLVQEGIGARGKTAEEAAKIAVELLQDCGRLEEMSRRAKAHALPDAAATITQKLLSMA